MSLWSQVGFADAKSLGSKNLILYHDMTMIVVVVVLTIVGGFLTIFLFKKLFLNNLTARYCYSNNKIEIFWSVVPAVFLVILAYFSLSLLYKHEVGSGVEHLVKATGHQWYWSYEYTLNMNNVSDEIKGKWEDFVSEKLLTTYTPYFESVLKVQVYENTEDLKNYMFFDSDYYENEEERLKMLCYLYYKFIWYDFSELFVSKDGFDLGAGLYSLFMEGDWYYIQESFNEVGDYMDKGELRCLQSSSPCYFVRGVKNELSLITADVMHSWGLPEMGVKVDAIPGRSNSVALIPYESGVVHGNCYELCGAGHSQMPISAVISNKEIFYVNSWENIINSEEADKEMGEKVCNKLKWLYSSVVESKPTEEEVCDPHNLLKIVSYSVFFGLMLSEYFKPS